MLKDKNKHKQTNNALIYISKWIYENFERNKEDYKSLSILFIKCIKELLPTKKDFIDNVKKIKINTAKKLKLKSHWWLEKIVINKFNNAFNYFSLSVYGSNMNNLSSEFNKINNLANLNSEEELNNLADPNSEKEFKNLIMMKY